MRVGGHHLARMYVITIALLVALAVVGAFSLGMVPVGLVVAVVACVLIEFSLVKVGKKKFRFPLSAIITGLIIGFVAPINASVLLVIAASAIAELAKFFVKAKARNIFNPAAVGLLVALLVFGVGDEWWAAPSIHLYGILVPLAAVLIIAAYEARRVPLALVVAAMETVGLAALSGFGISPGVLFTSLLAINFYFIFLMVSDPKTSPNKASGQVIYGIGIGLFAIAFAWLHLSYPLLVALLIANLLYACFRVFHRTSAKAGTAAAAATS